MRHSQGYWPAGPPKTQKSYRTIPLTDRAYSILKNCYDEKDSRKESETLSQVLEYNDSRTGENKCLIMRDLVFVNWRTGEPASIKTTMDRYVHVTDDSLVNAIRQFQQATLPVSKKGLKKGVQEI